uniref:DoxX family protein n=1 Tax=Trieres chinensis TaxID=1514140 RepID=A0A7S2EF20_TRICV|mmetsp:Transcript_21170/g.42715  ORF Transcript_21170/g.42715 Transcript_21170/m.42715 type:complete len:134 (+) Transcript_21170:100-501(+)|eukprot:CAMPEP_0183308334 /NCGR_PEP_ID=MMETSP0160_2-20130417/21439_1 /TAXON_ID=2839 ORGANISM="Odontella Sinensis, Strain Grunow 1884" /NCGR_SAMPLE_ID=MMETSP0160_2 /ASSEMBLY_ACC=CAM_ASM_000250 /LENGTH=133 /DNA_ID=CAMNT_0025472157 /DNA_START=100 /DNA_END=501 /DNA_ORIENTATION=+
MPPSMYNIGKSIASVSLFPGLFYVAAGLGLAKVPSDMEPFPGFWSDLVGINIPPSLFFLTIGSGKVAAIIGMWRASGGLREFFKFAAIFPPACGAFMHWNLGDGGHPPAIIFTGLTLALYLLPEPEVSKTKGS